MRETPEELKELQALLDASLSRSTSHLRSIINGERTLTAEQLTQVLTGMCTLALSTVTAKGEPRISGCVLTRARHPERQLDVPRDGEPGEQGRLLEHH
ncbi:hypothetical protein ACWCSH_47705, partial [Streptosporangium sp. NPDC001682]